MEEQNDTIEENSTTPKKKPVVFEGAGRDENRPNLLKQKLLLDAIETTQDRHKLKEMIGARSVAEVDRVFDVMANQKGFQKSLKNAGLDDDFLTTNLKNIITGAVKDSDKLNGIKIVMAARGIDKMESNATDISNWQDLIIKDTDMRRDAIEGEIVEEEVELYEVKAPELPAFLKNRDASIEGSHGQAAEDEVDSALKKIYE